MKPKNSECSWCLCSRDDLRAVALDARQSWLVVKFREDNLAHDFRWHFLSGTNDFQRPRMPAVSRIDAIGCDDVL